MLFNEKKAIEVMEEVKLDGLIASSWPNVSYLTEFYHSPIARLQYHLGEHQLFAIYPLKQSEKIILIAPMGDLIIILLESKNPDFDIYTYGLRKLTKPQEENVSLKSCEKYSQQIFEKYQNNFPSPEEALIAAIKKLNLDKNALGIDEMGVTPKSMRKIKEILPQASFKEAYDTWRYIRSVKTPREIELICRSTRILEKAIQAVLDEVKPGVSEMELVSILKKTMISYDAIPYLWNLGFGSESAITSREPTDRFLKNSDTIMIDAGCIYKGYYSDLARTAVLGNPSPRHVKYFQAIKHGQQAAINFLKPGVRAKEVFEVAVQTVQNAGIPHYKRDHCGHSTGIEPYDYPIISLNCTMILEENMVINIETPYYELGFGGLQIEDTFVLTKDGHYHISTAIPRELIRK